mmetsp:Transcript_16915/g.21409  ORF Transcript_16915/g.21409 Transcript_16915/m.21409 type:complete len:81 (+) Transcript_16915:42-284(+)
MASSEMRELVFHLAEAIRSEQAGSLQRLKEHHEAQIGSAESQIRKICKKKYQKFLDASASMDVFRAGLGEVRGNLGSIQD